MKAGNRLKRETEGTSIAILCGGRSSRFGANKCFHLLNGKELFLIIYERFSELSDDVFLQGCPGEMGSEDFFTKYNVPVHDDVVESSCALGGIYSAMANAVHQYVFVTGCDMPYQDPALFEILLSHLPANAVIPRWKNGFLEPLSALYSKDIAEMMRDSLEKGKFRVSDFLAEVDEVKFVEIEPLVEGGRIDCNTFRNVNRKSDLRC